ncbi:MAG: flagellar hook-basal body complex protein [Clostridium sp.]|nr:flagellar hook-basal body complex protein [Acetatifactor muris]MCM1526011.1 flagellar hook-basal body complex protein [Bacteroides sp.]MCM1562229.1 flagellar hook-basal body complex protein [Clostridium sp.]
MMRSLFSGVAGLKTHQTKMDVIGNNISNVNTTAYKSSSIVFSELMSQTTQRASGPNATTGTGGTNARQIGLGVKSGAINVNITGQGSSQSTGNPFDVMITGENFFVVSNGLENFFTRDGSFYVDGAGNLAMTSTGYNVMGWGVDEDTGNIKQDTVAALRIMNTVNLTYPPEATSQAIVGGIIDRNDKDVTSPSGKAINLNFYDSLGYAYTARLVFKQDGDNINSYSVEMTRLLDSTGKEIDISGITFGNQNVEQQKPTKLALNADAYHWDSTGKILQDNNGLSIDLGKVFKNDGTLQTDDVVVKTEGSGADIVETKYTVQQCLDEIAKAYGYEGSTDEFLKLYKTVDDESVSVQNMLANLAAGTGIDPTDDTTYDPNMFPSYATEAEMDGRYYDGLSIQFNPNTGKFEGLNGSPTQTSAILGLSQLGGNFADITLDFSLCSGFDNKGTSTVGADRGDKEGLGTGRKLGDMIGVSIQKDGMIYASYDNGMTRLLGQIATASFANASGLEKQGDNLYSATLNSGEFDGIGVDITANGGYMSTGQLEISNVDLSTEFTEMITTQRGFQANSRIITVSDTLLEELTNLKR